MSILLFSALLLIVSFFAGLLGALTGLGGGIIVIPALVLLFHINIHYAMGASLISVIATSSGTSIRYLRSSYINLRIGMFLETATVIGAFAGAILIAYISKLCLTLIFSLVMLFSAYFTIRRREEKEAYPSSHAWAQFLELNGSYQTALEKKEYQVQQVPLAFVYMIFAGMLSGLLGIGSGALKVLAMDQTLRLPYKVATTTSNFMIGITASVSAGIYFSYGYINPIITFPVLLGVLPGAYLGAKLLMQIPTHRLRLLFSIALCYIALQMLYNAYIGAI